MAPRPDAPDADGDRSWPRIAGAIAVVAVVALAAVVRFVALDARGVHWDEGVHAYYAWEFLATGEFTYEPWRHGPLLYFASVPAMALLGESVVAGRAAVGLLSLCLFPALWFLRDELPTPALAFSALVLAVHPYVLATARFYRNDVVLAAFALLAVGCYARYYRTGRWYWAGALGASAGLAFAAKEIAFLVFPAVAGAILVVVHFAARFETGSTQAALREYVPLRSLPVAAGGFLVVIVALFGGWPPSPTESPGAFLDGLAFWLSEGRREEGTLTYYLARLAVDTPALFALSVVGTAGTLLRPAASWFRWLFVAWAGLVALVLSLIGDQSWWNTVVIFVPMVLLAGYGLADAVAAGRWTVAEGRDRLGHRVLTHRVPDHRVPDHRNMDYRDLDRRPSERLAQSRRALVAVVLPTLAAAAVLAVVLGAVPTPDSVAGVDGANGSQLTDVEGVTVPDEPDARDRAFDAARAAALESDCGAVAGPGTYPWPARWWFRAVDYQRETNVSEMEVPAVVVTGEPVEGFEQAGYRVQAFDSHRVYVPPEGCGPSAEANWQAGPDRLPEFSSARGTAGSSARGPR